MRSLVLALGLLVVSPIAAEAAEAPALVAPDEVAAGHSIRVEWTGDRGRFDTILLVDPAANGGKGERLEEQRLPRSPDAEAVVTMPAPMTPGTYELRYWSRKEKAVRASRSIKVRPGKVSILGPSTVERAGTIEAQWEGPGGEYDMVRLFDPDGEYGNHGELQIIREKRVRTQDFENRRVELIAPHIPGIYVLQYIDGRRHKALASQPIEVLDTEISVAGPTKAVAEETLEVRWVGPAALHDEVQIVNAKGRVRTRQLLTEGDVEAKTVEISAPKKAGSFTLRYWSAANRKALATQPLEVVAAAGEDEGSS